MVKGPSELHPVFTVSLDGVAISHEKVEGAVACVQDFGRHPLFTQRNFFSETGISMLNTAVTAADAVRHSSEFDPSGAIGVEASPVFADLKSCREKVVPRRKAFRDTRERWFCAETIASSTVGEAAPRTTVRVSFVVEVRDKEYVEEHDKLGLPCCCRSSPGKSKKRRVPVSPVVAKKQFSVESPSASRPSFEAVLERVLRSRVRKGVIVIAVIPQFFKGHASKSLIVYMFELLAFDI